MLRCRFQKGSKERYALSMQAKRKPVAWILAGTYVLWTVVIQPVWNLNIERLAEKQKLDTTLANGAGVMDWLQWLVGYVPSSFGLGFVVGALIFAYWDVIATSFRRRVLRRRDEVIPVEENEWNDIRAWVGQISPYFDLGEDGCARFLITVVSVGDMPFRISQLVSGSLMLTYMTGSGSQKKVKLPSPYILDNPTIDAALERGYLGKLWLAQPIPPTVAKDLPDTFSWKPYPSLDFSDLRITLMAEDGSAKKNLRLWDSMRLSAGEDRVRCDETMRLSNASRDPKDREKALAAAAQLVSQKRG